MRSVKVKRNKSKTRVKRTKVKRNTRKNKKRRTHKKMVGGAPDPAVPLILSVMGIFAVIAFGVYQRKIRRIKKQTQVTSDAVRARTI